MEISRVICDDWDDLYDKYINTTKREECDVELILGNFGTNLKCLDYNHDTGSLEISYVIDVILEEIDDYFIFYIENKMIVLFFNLKNELNKNILKKIYLGYIYIECGL